MTVAVAMSGGVDSSTAAALLLERGERVEGVTLRLQPQDGVAARAATDARAVARHLGIPLRILDGRRLFAERVIRPFVAAYRSGRTPNPCILCNRALKFGWLREQVLALGYDRLATGHYARVEGPAGARRLLRAADSRKDQSYFLVPDTVHGLDRVLFPLGTLSKGQVRELAAERRLPVADKDDSQDVCFLPSGGLAAFLVQWGAGLPPGPVVDLEGRVLGRHRGIHAYTVGQRRGLGIAAPEPLYVVRKEFATNRLVVGPRQALQSATLWVRGLRWLAGDAPAADFGCTVKIRSTAVAVPCRVRVDDGWARVDFQEPQFGVAPGQMAVFYAAEEVLGGGWIEGPD